MEFSKAVVYFLSAKVFEIVPLKDCPEWSSKKMTELKNGDTVTLQIERDYVPASAIVIQIGREEDNLLVTLQHAHELKKKKKFSVEKIKKIIKPLHPKGRQHLPNIHSHFTDIDYETDAARASHGIALGPQDSVTMDEDETTPATTSQPSRKGAALGVPAMDPEYETGAAASSAATTGPDSDDEIILEDTSMTSRNVPLNTKKSVTSFRQQFEATMGVSVATIEGLSNLVMMNIKQNATMNARLRTIESHLATLVNSSEARPKIPASFASDFPLDSKEAYETWVETLESDPIKREHLVNLLELQNDMGSFNASVRRMIGLLLSSKLQTQFNRTGSKQKLSFAKCLEPLLKVALRPHKRADVDIEVQIMKFLKDAPTRARNTMGKRYKDGSKKRNLQPLSSEESD